jgi:D-alanine-D-alanine ligase
MSSKKKIVAVIFGGRSAEHEISIITGLEIIKSLDTDLYEPKPVYIDSRGRWFTGSELLNKEFYKGLPDALDRLTEVMLLPVPGVGGLTVRQSSGFSVLSSKKEKVLPVDVFLPAFHGQFGEDGCIQGLFELADVCYTGCGVLASSVAMNKYTCKSTLFAHGIPVLPATVVSKQYALRDIAAAREQIYGTQGLSDFPLFVKPGNLGSSVGVGRASDEAELDAALAKVFELDTEAIVEPCVERLMEINVSVLEGEKGPEASVVEIPVASAGALSYEDKYMRKGKGKKGPAEPGRGMASLTRVIDPGDLAPEIKQSVIRHALDSYGILGCAGVVRFDFIYDLDTEELYFNELNPLPGSMAFYLWEKTQPPVLYPEMLTRIIVGAEKRKELKRGLRRDLGFRALF